ncbi:MAG TPA: hypothetical protein PKA63_00485 [Oligoflexia bacterium]|nr:hypothetical protein [Oligoflexia bacterium]HMP47126.1 hypothetical protein [Oligoflexia bacterium]
MIFYNNSLSKLLVLSLLTLNSCDGNAPRIPNSLEKKIEETFTELTENSTIPIDEFKKLSQLEYKLITFPLDTPSGEIESRLSDIGKDRWDCYSTFIRRYVEPNPNKSESIRPRNTETQENPRYNNSSKSRHSRGSELAVLCKRMPETVLRYIPKGIIR